MKDRIHTLGAEALARALAKGELSSVEVVDALSARADAVEPRLNAWAVRLHAQAREEAARCDADRARGQLRGPLHGVPISIKENLAVAGTASTMGLQSRKGRIEESDAAIVRRVREQGGIVLGKGNVPQFLLAMESENNSFGTTKNPWKLDRSPGGSSGGEAALLASGQVPLSVGTDIGGSIRQPAAFCGVTGLKPTVHRWPNSGGTGAMPGQESVRSQVGPMARSSADLIYFWRALTGPALGDLDPHVPPLPLGEFPDLRGRRVGFYEDDGLFRPSPAMRRAVREAAEQLRAAGAEVVEFTPPNVEAVAAAYFGVISADGALTMRRQLQGEALIPALQNLFRVAMLPGFVRRGVAALMQSRGEKRVHLLLSSLGEKGVDAYWKLTAERNRLQAEEKAAWDKAGIDLLITPAHGTPAVRLRESGEFAMSAVYAMRYNLLNLPAGTVPVTRVRPEEQAQRSGGDRVERIAARMDEDSAGLPCAVQVVGRPWREESVLAGMLAIEAGARSNPDFPLTPVDP